jgi:hypothetical protein
MRKTKIIAAVLSLLVLFNLAGCGVSGDNKEWKDNAISGFNDWMQSFSRHALTKERKLQGEKEQGDDVYVGSYTAEYDQFNGEEYLFGGTALERDNGSSLKAIYTLKITSGSATLYWLEGGEENIIANADADSSYDFTLCSGDNYIILKGDDFSGSLTLTVE